MSERRFRIMGGPSVPWRMVTPYEQQALLNHDQSLERLNERGGLCPRELWCVVHGKRLRDRPSQEAADAWLKQWLEADMYECGRLSGIDVGRRIAESEASAERDDLRAALNRARAAAQVYVERVDALGLAADDNDPKVIATAEPLGEAQANLYAALGLLQRDESGKVDVVPPAETIEQLRAERDSARMLAEFRGAERDDLRAQVARLTEERDTFERFMKAEVEHNQRLGERNVEAIRILGGSYPHGVAESAQAVVIQLAAALAERDALKADADQLKHMCVCIECGRCKIDEDGCCTTCGRDALLLEDGRLVTKDFADNLEADVQRQTADRIASHLEHLVDEGRYTLLTEHVVKAIAEGIRANAWRKP